MRRRACPRLSFTSTIFSSKTSELLYSSVFFSLFSHSHQPRLLFVPFGVYIYDVLFIPIQTLLLFCDCTLQIGLLFLSHLKNLPEQCVLIKRACLCSKLPSHYFLSVEQPIRFQLSIAYASLGISSTIEDNSRVNMPY